MGNAEDGKKFVSSFSKALAASTSAWVFTSLAINMWFSGALSCLGVCTTEFIAQLLVDTGDVIGCAENYGPKLLGSKELVFLETQSLFKLHLHLSSHFMPLWSNI